MDEDLVSALILISTGLFMFLGRYGIIPPHLVYDLWPAILIITGLLYLYYFFKRKGSHI